jgi:hypothetical protein
MSLVAERVVTKKDVYQTRIASIVDQIMREDQDHVYAAELDRREIIAELADFMKRHSVREFAAMGDKDLKKRVKPMMTAMLLPHLLDGLSEPEKAEVFAAMKGR